jgi:CheY-like chemotaxis protein/HPt (histidine-containing phosphotransfer) domain-containing protein
MPTVTMVDDEPWALDVLVRAARSWKFDCQAARSAEQALELLQRDLTPIVVTDLRMPGRGGVWLVREIRRRWPDRPLRIIGMTAHAMDEDRDACFAAGMDDYVAKHDVGETLRGVLERWLRNEGVAQDGGKSSPPARAGASLELFVKPSVLRLMERDGEAGGASGLYEKFCADSKAEVESLKTHARRGDAERLRRTAHRLKGRADIYGLERLAKLCAEIERGAETGEISSPEEGVKAVEMELGLLRGAIEYERGSN